MLVEDARDALGIAQGRSDSSTRYGPRFCRSRSALIFRPGGVLHELQEGLDCATCAEGRRVQPGRRLGTGVHAGRVATGLLARREAWRIATS